ncbi:hypothetical protein [Methylocystis parvus]|uniref:Uncharacterized protein n=1 Tax=Methylocystis parvus TaxID=134 RepID=A0A6B8M3F8_9HYPH|nr:hypothetical protein [Methylocystis parvus]QGM98414.1 hypothetical protein F7D14_13625 [Methylocystis parvus]WBK01253.1 hypothetical protein MMG94_05945 [Methylocystis parvus OBBP]
MSVLAAAQSRPENGAALSMAACSLSNPLNPDSAHVDESGCCVLGAACFGGLYVAVGSASPTPRRLDTVIDWRRFDKALSASVTRRLAAARGPPDVFAGHRSYDAS